LTRPCPDVILSEVTSFQQSVPQRE
jgi:hypothetical protein